MTELVVRQEVEGQTDGTYTVRIAFMGFESREAADGILQTVRQYIDAVWDLVDDVEFQ